MKGIGMQEQHIADSLRPQADEFFPAEPEPEWEITLERVVSTTQMLGHRIFASQLLVEVNPASVFHCPQCDKAVADVVVGSLGDYVANVISRWNDTQFLANLVSEHYCEAKQVSG